jgi:hypothetical protein
MVRRVIREASTRAVLAIAKHDEQVLANTREDTRGMVRNLIPIHPFSQVGGHKRTHLDFCIGVQTRNNLRHEVASLLAQRRGRVLYSAASTE